MSETNGQPGLLSAARYARLVGINRSLLEILLRDGYIRGAVQQGRKWLVPPSLSLDENQLQALGRVAYEESLQALAAAALKLHSILTKALTEIEDALEHGIKPVRELGQSIVSLDSSSLSDKPFDQLRLDLAHAQWKATRYQSILWQLDQIDRIHERKLEWAAKWLD